MSKFTLASNKINGRHLDRWAVVYVRQSSMQQLVHNQESTRMQYGLVDRAVALGWPRERVVVIDDDLGRSGASAEGRPGFQRLVADVGLDRVGLVLGIEMSRLARSCRDWHQLLEVCAVFGTLLADLDGVYDPVHHNDRLLLGLKGAMSEAELHVIKQRMQAGRLNKLQRGELSITPPTGYMRRLSGEIVKDPDEQAQTVIESIFAAFERVGTIDGVLRHCVEQGLQLPWRSRTGANKGELEWRRANRETLACMLKNPAYAGAYVWGRRRTDVRRKKPGRPKTGQVIVPQGEWQVCIKDHLPAYISWEQYERNLKQINDNAPKAKGAVRKGLSLLAGLVHCGRCGARMHVRYSANARHYYECVQARVSFGGPRCQSLSGKHLDAFIVEQALRALQPAALEVSLQVAADVQARRDELHAHWRQRLERAKFEADRAFRQYDAVDPENRLVARGLERRWEQALSEQQLLQDAYAREAAQAPSVLTQGEHEAIRGIARDLPALWHGETTTVQDRQTVLRHLIERIAVVVDDKSERVQVTVTYKGGHETDGEFTRSVGSLQQLSSHEQLLIKVAQLRHEGHDLRAIAGELNALGFRSPRKHMAFTATMVHDLLQRQGLTRSARTTAMIEANEWPIIDLARELGMPKVTAYRWATRGVFQARERSDMSDWIVLADDDELRRLRQLREKSPAHARQRQMVNDTTHPNI